jgi:integrase
MGDSAFGGLPHAAVGAVAVLNPAGTRHPDQTRRPHPADLPDRNRSRALLAAPDRTTRTGRRDHTLVLLMIQTGLRVSELVGLRRRDLTLGTTANVRCEGKGRKQRCTRFSRSSSAILAASDDVMPGRVPSSISARLPHVRNASGCTPNWPAIRGTAPGVWPSWLTSWSPRGPMVTWIRGRVSRRWCSAWTSSGR